jgi:hypothetical protein
MENLDITVTFIGGLGQVNFAIFLNGSQVQKLAVTDDGTTTVPLQTGSYLISLTGVNAPEGVTIGFSKATDPITPETITMNPIFRGYTVTIN